jgi:cell division protein FtsQ
MEMREEKFNQSTLQYLTQAFKISLLGLFILSCLFLCSEYNWSQFFPIKTVRVYGINHVDKHEVQTMIRPLVNRGFFTVNVDYIRDRMLEMPWVADIFVRRNWPDQVEITVVERKPIARWNNASLVSQNGDLFSPKEETYPANLPQFVGPEGQQAIMLQYFHEMNRALQPLHAKISYLEMTPFFTWKLKLDNGIMMQIEHKDILTRLAHFVKVYPKIIGNRSKDVEYIDLRYPNGVAVRWKV